MKSKKLFEEIGNINENLIEQAAFKSDDKTKNIAIWYRWASFAACFVLIASVVAVIIPLIESNNIPNIFSVEESSTNESNEKEKGLSKEDDENSFQNSEKEDITSNDNMADPSQNSDQEESTKENDGINNLIFVNEVNSISNAANEFPPDCYEEVWSWDEVLSYYGKNIKPTYIPDNLFKISNDTDIELTMRGDGTLYCDVVDFLYREKSEDDVFMQMTPTISISISKMNFFGDMIIDFKTEKKVSNIKNIEVMIGCEENNYGDEKYDAYIAVFNYDNVYYRVYGSNISLDEFIKTISGCIE